MFDAFSASLDIPFGRAIDELIQDFSLFKNQVRLQMLCSMGLTIWESLALSVATERLWIALQ
jgi:hypothetical protein